MTIRSHLKDNLGLVIVLSPFMAWTGIHFWLHPEAFRWDVAIVGLLAPALVLLWVQSFKIDLDNNGIRFRSGLSPSRYMPYTAIKSLHVKVLDRRQPGAYRQTAFYRLMIDSRDSEYPGLAINIKVFGAAELQQLVNELRRNAPDATVDHFVESLQKRNLSPIAYAGVKGLISFLPFLIAVAIITAFMRAYSR